MDPVSAATVLGAIAGVLIALGVIAKYLRKMFNFFKRIEEANRITIEFPEWQAKVNSAIKELHPNSGSSLKDQVTAINTKICETEQKVDTMGNSLEEIRNMLQAHVEDDQLHS